MDREKRLRKRLVALFLSGVVLFSYPIISLFNLDRVVFGYPLLYVYLFSFWLALIIMLMVVTRERKKSRE